MSARPWGQVMEQASHILKEVAPLVFENDQSVFAAGQEKVEERRGGALNGNRIAGSIALNAPDPIPSSPERTPARFISLNPSGMDGTR